MLDPIDETRAFITGLGKTVETMGKKINRDQTVIEKLTLEIAQLIRQISRAVTSR